VVLHDHDQRGAAGYSPDMDEGLDRFGVEIQECQSFNRCPGESNLTEPSDLGIRIAFTAATEDSPRGWKEVGSGMLAKFRSEDVAHGGTVRTTNRMPQRMEIKWQAISKFWKAAVRVFVEFGANQFEHHLGWMIQVIAVHHGVDGPGSGKP
jgi:hypothetical protein